MIDQGPFTVDSARAAADAGRLPEWVARFLASEGSDNPALADQLTGRLRWWRGPLELPIGDLHRLAGPEGEPVLVVVDDDEWRDDVDDLEEKVSEGWELPPVIVSYRSGQLVLEDGNHRVEGMRRAGEQLAWAIVGFDDHDACERFEPPARSAVDPAG